MTATKYLGFAQRRFGFDGDRSCASRDRLGDKIEAAYRRGDLFVKQRALAEPWARYCDGAEIVSFSGRGTVGVAQVLTQDKSLPLVKA